MGTPNYVIYSWGISSTLGTHDCEEWWPLIASHGRVLDTSRTLRTNNIWRGIGSIQQPKGVLLYVFYVPSGTYTIYLLGTTYPLKGRAGSSI